MAIGFARMKDDPREGSLQVAFSSLMPWANYDILETDYNNYAVVHSCQQYVFGLYKSEFSWILSREPLGPGEKLSQIEKNGRKVLEKNGIETAFLRHTK